MAQVPKKYRNNEENSEENSYPPIPAGKRLAVLEESEYIENKDKTGMNMKLVWQIIEEPNKGSKLFEYLCLEHPRVSTVQQAWRTFNKINDLCGFPAGKRALDSSQLHNIPIMLDIQCDIKNTFPNSIREHLPAKGVSSQQKTQQSVNQPEEVPPPVEQPWNKK